LQGPLEKRSRGDFRDHGPGFEIIREGRSSGEIFVVKARFLAEARKKGAFQGRAFAIGDTVIPNSGSNDGRGRRRAKCLSIRR